MNENKKTFKIEKYAIYLCAFFLPLLMMQIFWAMSGIYPYGDNSILTGDMNLEFVNFYGYFINTFKSNSDWSYMFAKTIGGDYPGLAAFQLHDPLLFILFFFPGEKIAAGIQFMFSLQVSLASLSMSILLNNRYKKSWISLLFSTAYAFVGYFFGYLVLTIYFGCLAILPLLIYFFLRFLDDNRFAIPYMLLTVFYIYLNFHMGFMLVIFLCILFVSRIIADSTYVSRIKQFIISGITILLMDGFFLIRTGLSLLGEKTTETADYGFYRRFQLNQLFAGFYSMSAKNELMPLIYCSVAAVFFALIFLLSSKVKLREKLADIFVISVIVVSMWINTFDAVWHGFNNPEGFYFRYAFFISFMVIVMGYRGAMLLKDMMDTDDTVDTIDTADTDEANISKKVMLAGGIILLYMVWLKISGNVYINNRVFVLNAVLICAIAVSLLAAIKGTGFKDTSLKTYAYAVIFLISICEMLCNAKSSYISFNSYGGELTKMSKFRDDYSNINDVISYIKGYDDSFYRIEKDFDRAVNDPALFDYAGMSHDSSCEKDEVIDWLNNFGFPRTVYYTYYNDGGTSFTDSFFGIKYYVSRFDETPKPYDRLPYEGKYFAYNNEYALPIAYIAPKGLKDYDFTDEDTFRKQNALASFWGIGDDIYKEAGHELTLDGVEEIEPGHYKKISDEGSLVYNIDITEDMALYLYFAAPHRQGAEVMVNGEDRGRYFSENHWNVLHAGTYKKGDKVEIRLMLLEDEIEVIKPCFYYEDAKALEAFCDKATEYNEGMSQIEKVRSSYLRFDVNNKEDKNMVMSVPYDKCWKVTCDGKKLDTYNAVQMLMGFDIPSGEHHIELKYTPRGTYPGLATSFVGLILFAILSFLSLRKKDEQISAF